MKDGSQKKRNPKVSAIIKYRQHIKQQLTGLKPTVTFLNIVIYVNCIHMYIKDCSEFEDTLNTIDVVNAMLNIFLGNT